MKVSIVLPTNREGGLDITFNALEGQSMWPSDYELIIVDDYRDRRDQVSKLAGEHGVENVKYMQSKGPYWRTNRPIANARNTGLMHAEGELVIFIDDYIWFPSHFLRRHWKTYKETEYCMIGSSRPVRYAPDQIDNIESLPPPKLSDEEYRKKLASAFTTSQQRKKALEMKKYHTASDGRGDEPQKGCPPGWFFCMNASAPLEKIIEVNGFNEVFDLTSEEDIDLGLRLSRVGCKFWYRTCYHCVIAHMEHGSVESAPKKYKEVTYQQLRDRGTLESKMDEVQLVMKEKYDTEHDGSWGLHEYYEGRKVANIVDGEKIFDLKEEREERGYRV